MMGGGGYSGSLFGRVGTYAHATVTIVAFWNTDKDDYKLLDDCMRALDEEQVLFEPIYISTPIHSVVKWEGQLSTGRDLSPEELRKVELQQQMHLMRGTAKKKAMKELGLGWTEPKQHGTQAALRKAELLAPGQKWWSMYGDGLDRQGHVVR